MPMRATVAVGLLALTCGMASADRPVELDRPATIGLVWRQTYIAGRVVGHEANRVSLSCPQRPREVLIDGEPLGPDDWQYGAGPGRLMLRMADGAHRLLVRLKDSPQRRVPEVELPAGRSIPLTTIANHDTDRVYHTGSPDIEPGRYRASIAYEAVAPSVVSLSVGDSAALADLAPTEQERTVELGVLATPPDARVTVSSSLDGCTIARLVLTPATDINLVDNGDMELEADGDGLPDGYRAGSITNGAMCELGGAGDAHSGTRCLKVVCTQPGGDYAGNLRFQTVWPVSRERRFKVTLCVKTDDDATATIQLTSQNWKWWTNSPRVAKAADWTQVEHTFVLPADENITHARLHMRATKPGATLYVDDIELKELL